MFRGLIKVCLEDPSKKRLLPKNASAGNYLLHALFGAVNLCFVNGLLLLVFGTILLPDGLLILFCIINIIYFIIYLKCDGDGLNALAYALGLPLAIWLFCFIVY